MGDIENSVTRRNVVGLLGLMGIGTVIETRGPGRAIAQTSATPASKDQLAVVQEWVDAYNARDAVAMAALYGSDAVYEDVPNSFKARGDEIPAFLATAEQGLGDVRIEVTNAFETDRGAAVEYLFHATNQGLIPIPDTVGKAFTSRAVTIFEFEGGKIRRSSDYYDLLSILTQIGAMPPMGGAATPSAATAPGG